MKQLLNSTEEMREYLPISLTFEFKDVLPFIKQVENDILIPVLSQALFDSLQTKIENNDTLDTAETKLLEKCRAVIAPLSIVYWMAWGQVQINSSGIQIASNTEMKTAFAWQVEGLEVSATELGYSCLERLHKYLLGSSFVTAWKETDEYKALTKNFINTVSSFRAQCSNLKSRYSFELIKGIMSRIEDNQIRAALGNELYDEIKSEILSGSVSDDNHYLFKFIYPAVANLTMNEALVELGTRIDTYGVTFYTGTANNKQVNKQDAKQVGILQMKSNEAGLNYLSQLSKYLQENADTYPLFKYSSAYVAPVSDTPVDIKTDTGTYYTG